MVVLKLVNDFDSVIKNDAQNKKAGVYKRNKQWVKFKSAELQMKIFGKGEEGELLKGFFQIEKEKVVNFKARDVRITVQYDSRR